MKRLFIVIIVLSLLFSLSMTGCQSLVKGSGELKTEDFAFTDFTRVVIDGPFEVTGAYADNYTVSITPDDNIFKKMVITNEDET